MHDVFVILKLEEVSPGEKMSLATWTIKPKSNGDRKVRNIMRGYDQDGDHYGSASNHP